MKDPRKLKDLAEIEAYEYFSQNIRPLPRDDRGSIQMTPSDFVDNDVDAFRHAYVSGIFTHEFGERVATVLGWLNEGFPLPSPKSNTNMDLWNNEVGRRLARKNKTKDALLKAVEEALRNGLLITQPSDNRSYQGYVPTKPEGKRSVIVLKQGKRGANEWFFDFSSARMMVREEFVNEIRAGRYPGYSLRTINGSDCPVAKRDRDVENNLG
jgi:hypothetical protein